MFRATTTIVLSALVLAACSEVHEADLVPGSTPDARAVDDGAMGLADASEADASSFMDASVNTPDAANPGDASVDAHVDGAVLVDVCDNAQDQAGLVALGGDFQQILQEQGIPCFIQAMGGPRFAMCIARALEEYVSEDCALCVGEQADCLVSNCIDRCLADQGGEACIACVCEAGCVESFRECSGVDFGPFECPEP